MDDRPKKEIYRAVVETGTCDMDGRYWEERETCGHNHRSIETASACLAKKQRGWCNHGRPAGSLCARCYGYAKYHVTSALWYRGTIHNQDCERV